jgi:hypothetical protein
MTRLEHVCAIGQCVGLFGLGLIALLAPQARKLETLAPSRTQTWADAVEACEAHGGVAVPRATKVLGRSADLPACVPQLGD